MNSQRKPQRVENPALLNNCYFLKVRFALRPPRKGEALPNPAPLQVSINVRGVRRYFGAVWKGVKLVVDPQDWRVDKQASIRRNDSLNARLIALRGYIESLYQRQVDAGAKPTMESVRYAYKTGKMPEWRGERGWVYIDTSQPRNPKTYNQWLAGDSNLLDAYAAYIAHLEERKGTAQELNRITLGRWHRGHFLLTEYVRITGQPLPTAEGVTIGWAKRYHTWLQTQDGGRFKPIPISEGQASRFVLKVSNVLTWMIENDRLSDNPIAKVGWPKSKDKEVEFLEPAHIAHLLTLKWEGTRGVSLWWFCLMCCTGMDYPDAVAYAKNREGYEVLTPNGWKIVGRRKKPPHNEFHIPVLDEVKQLFALYPKGPRSYTGNSLNGYTTDIEIELGIEWRITAKTARKTFGNLMLAAGHRISDVSLMLGHGSVMMTERHYVKVRGESVDRSMGRVNVSISELANTQRPAPL